MQGCVGRSLLLSQGRKLDGFAHPSSVRPGPSSRKEGDSHQGLPNTLSSPAQRMAEGHPVQEWQWQQLCQTQLCQTQPCSASELARPAPERRWHAKSLERVNL